MAKSHGLTVSLCLDAAALAALDEMAERLHTSRSHAARLLLTGVVA